MHAHSRPRLRSRSPHRIHSGAGSEAGRQGGRGMAGVQPRLCLLRNEKSAQNAQNDFIQFRSPLFFSAGHPRDAVLAAISPDWAPSGGYIRANCTPTFLDFPSLLPAPLCLALCRVPCRLQTGGGLAQREKPSIALPTVRSRAWRCISRILGVLGFCRDSKPANSARRVAACCSAAELRPRPCSTVDVHFATRSFRAP